MMGQKSEHWLWSFELHRLREVHPNFYGDGVADRRLHKNRDAGTTHTQETHVDVESATLRNA